MDRIKNSLGRGLASLALLAGSLNSCADEAADNIRIFGLKTGYFSTFSAFHQEKLIDYTYYRTDLIVEKIFGENKDVRASLVASFLKVDNGFGSFYAGPGFSVKYGFVDNEKFFTGLIFGCSALYTDAYMQKSYGGRDQRYVGSPVEFNSRLGLDFELNLNKNLAIVAESCVEHISNGGLSSRNRGINTFGFMAGISKAF